MHNRSDRQPITVLFDLDGTLIDTIELIVASARHAFASRPGPTPSEADFVANIGQPLVKQFAQYCDTESEMQALIASYREYQLAHHDRLTNLYQGILEAVVELRESGHPLGVVTSKMDGIARRSLSHVGLDTYMDVVIGCDATERHKPDPEPVLLALERLGAVPDRALFIGDSPFDIAAGNAAGVATVAAVWGAFSRETLLAAGPTYVVETPADIPGLVRDYERRTTTPGIQTLRPDQASHPVGGQTRPNP